jgi:capsid protein
MFARSERIIQAGNGKTEPRNVVPLGDSGSKLTGGTDDLLGSVSYNHTELRGKSRKATFDSPAVASLQQRKVQGVVDIGIRVDPTPDIEEIGLSDQQAASFIRFARGFNDWMASKKQHRREQMTFFQGQAIAQNGKMRDGEYFLRVYYNYKDRLPHPLQWEILDPDQFPDYSATYSQDGFALTDTVMDSKRTPEDSIEKDDRGRPKRYWIEQNENGTIKHVKIKAKTADGRYQIIHGFSPEYSFQTRGFPAISKILQDSHLMQTFSLANISKAINQSQRVFAVSNKDRDPTSPFGDLTPEALGQALDGFYTQSGNGDAEPTEEAIRYVNSPLFRSVALQVNPGAESLLMAEAGTDIKSIENTAPVTEYDAFVGSFFSFLAAAENVPVEVALMKFGQNYSASRAALIMFYRVCEIERADMDADLISPFYEMYIAEGIASGYVAAPGWSDPRLREMYIRHRTIGAPMPSIDPARESTAVLNQIGVGSTSFPRAAHNLNGSDVEKNLTDNEKYADRIRGIRERLGLNKTAAPVRE